MKLSMIAFTRNGGRLANVLQEKLVNSSITCQGYIIEKYYEGSSLLPLTSSLQEWTKEQFHKTDAILFISACGIAVRAIAPYIEDKTKDPAVMVMDEQGNYCISLLSGHIGGANELTTLISSICNAVPVITTATDINHRFSVDLFAVKNGLVIHDMKLAKEISGAILDGEQIPVCSDFELLGTLPNELIHLNQSKLKSQHDLTILKNHIAPLESSFGIYITLSPYRIKPFPNTLFLIPKIVSLGIGCKKDTPFDTLHNFIHSNMRELGLSMDCIKNIASIDLKEKEPALLELSTKYNLEFITYTPLELNSIEGEFHESEFVKSITGVGNVCERAATLASNHGQLILTKQAKDGVTMALSFCNRRITF